MLVQWIVCTDQPFTVVHHPLFQAILTYMRPELAEARGFSDKSIAHQILLNFSEMRLKVKHYLEVSQEGIVFYIFSPVVEFLWGLPS